MFRPHAAVLRPLLGEPNHLESLSNTLCHIVQTVRSLRDPVRCEQEGLTVPMAETARMTARRLPLVGSPFPVEVWPGDEGYLQMESVSRSSRSLRWIGERQDGIEIRTSVNPLSR